MKALVLLFGMMVRHITCQIFGGEMTMPDDGIAKEEFPDLWFNQTLDHFSDGPATYWSQRYFVNEAPWNYYGRPQDTSVFLKIGGEGAISKGWMKGGSWVQWAWNHCALLIQLEHRFYGDSHPTPDLSVDNLKYLTSEQAIEDIRSFIKAINKQYNFTDNKWFVFGGSYPGCLVAWSRLKLPDLIAGGVSSSGPLQAIVDFYQYDQVVSKSLERYSPGCGKELTKAIKSLQQSLNSTSATVVNNIAQKFNVCSGYNFKDSKNVNVFFQSLFTPIAQAVQYNNIDKPTERILYVCAYLNSVNIKDPVDRLAMLMNATSESCLYTSYRGSINSYKSTSWLSYTAKNNAKQWLYQTCNEFGYYQTSSTKDSLFSNTLPVGFFTQQCTDIFNNNFNSRQLANSVSSTNRRYQGWNIRVKNVAFVQGSDDPWNPLGIIKHPTADSPLFFINGSTHTQDMNNPSGNDPPGLTDARKKIEALLATWMST